MGSSSSGFAGAFEQLLAALNRLEIRYAVGGSLASSLYGHYRLTNDVDVLVDAPADALQEFVAALGPDFYADEATLRASFEAGRPANVIHMRGGFKFDLFPVSGREFERSELRRSVFRSATLAAGVPPVEFAVTSPEDIVLAKLRWFRKGGEVSEQQWKDIAGVVSTQGERLDRAYLKEWAARLGVADLLERALLEAR